MEKTYTKHGLTKHKLYRTWTNMRHRCLNIKNPRYYRYGGRGIKICDAWENDCSAFIRWAEESGWESGLTLERIDNDGGYNPQNCKWATIAEQSRNKRNNVSVKYGNKNMILSDFIRNHAIVSDGCIRGRVANGWDIVEAGMTTANNGRGKGADEIMVDGKLILFSRLWEKYKAKCNLDRNTVRYRLKKGWSIHDAINTPKFEKPDCHGLNTVC